jgi:acetylornithine/succinyldiaminopimelate/putrescine aminotransferase
MAAEFVPVRRSLTELLGPDYIRSVCDASAFLAGADRDELAALAREPVDFYPRSMQEHLASQLDRVGTQVIDSPLSETAEGATSAAFRAATRTAAAPLSARGYYRVGEDGRLYLTTKSEHYHASVGHGFPGYRLLETARKLGLPNATHNNTRGQITRLLEEELVRTANGIERGNRDGLAAVLSSGDDLRVLNRVLNLETGSLAAEAALKMILARFYRAEPEMPEPPYAGRMPVVLVLANDDGGLRANYHGTTVLTQTMRGMWPGLHETLERTGAWKVVPIRPNRTEDLDRAFAEFERGRTRIAGFFHEIIMMNYGGRRLTPEFLTHAYTLCERHDVPTVADEIQSCMWSPRLYLSCEYGLRPTFLAIGKGFPGGEYPASRLLFSAALDSMPQFGALVTNGQEELASLAYLVTMAWAEANADVTAKLGAHYHERLSALAARHPREIEGIDGWNHMSTIRFTGLEAARSFIAALRARGLDISAQTYKPDCPPVVLTKLPLIADRRVIDWVVARMEETMCSLGRGGPEKEAMGR